MRRTPVLVGLALTSGLALASLPQDTDETPSYEAAPRDTVRIAPSAAARARARDLEAWLAANPTSRAHLSSDRPLYRPGDAVNVKLWSAVTRGLAPSGGNATIELLDPRGVAVRSESVALANGGGDTKVSLDKSAPGGAWTLRATLPDGRQVTRAITVASFEAPRIKKDLEFSRDGYAPGDTVDAVVSLSRATGEILANQAVTASVRVAGQVLPPMALKTDARGDVLVRFPLPSNLADPDVLLTVLVDDGGATESISRAVPVTMSKVNVGFFPEGGDLVAGLESRVYFEATDPKGSPVDLAGVLLDDRDREVGRIASRVDGRGHFEFTPVAGRSYRVRVDGRGDFRLPEARSKGCVMHHYDDLDGVDTSVRVGVACTSPQDVTVLATQQEQILDRATFHVEGSKTVYLETASPALAKAQGVARVTLFDASGPVAERLVFRNKARSLRVQVTPDRDRYAPGDEVALTVRTTDGGRPVAAQVALSVVDDTLLAFADDDADSLASGLLLQADLPEPIEGASKWFRPDAKDGGLAVDLALGTRGWRRFDWTQIEGWWQLQRDQERMMREEARYYRDRRFEPRLDFDFALADDEAGLGGGLAFGAAVPRAAAVGTGEAPRAKPADEVTKSTSTRATVTSAISAPERQFAPSLPKAAPRSDFRDTVLWKPAIETGADGVAKVTFKLNDAVTSFRASAEGLGGGMVGGGDALVVSTLPFHVEARLPVALTTGDHLDLPITVENQRRTPTNVGLSARAGALLKLGAMPELALNAGERRTIWLPVDVRPGQGAMSLSLDAQGAGTTDAITRTIPVFPRGVPQRWSVSGRLDGPVTQAVTVPKEALEGSVSGKLTLLPTPISEILSGIESMVRTPGGCFEQTSSTNWPNVVVLDLLQQSGELGKLAVDRKQVLDTGYGILTHYQVQSGGFETWGSGPGKEALTAYGLLEFSDMDRVYDVSPKLLEDNAKYLLDQRTGDGGYRVTGSSAHGYGTAPPDVLDAYITYALVETGHLDIPKELDKSAALARTSKDPYRMGLATLTLLKARPNEGKAAAARLATLQAADGSFPGSETSITRSENYNLDVEATALSSMALLRAGDVARAQRAVKWLHDHQTGAGTWGATQGNALALRAIGELAAVGTRGDKPGKLSVMVDGELVRTLSVDAGGRDPIEVDLPFSVGTHTVSVSLDGMSVPYALEAGWTTELPASDASRRLDLSTSLADSSVAVGKLDRLTATVTNRTGEVVPDPIARIGLPAGLEAQTWQLEALKKAGKIAFFETRPREVTLYWDGLAAGAKHEIALDLVAMVPGTFTAPASSAYPYYDDQAKAWVPGTEVRVSRN